MTFPKNVVNPKPLPKKKPLCALRIEVTFKTTIGIFRYFWAFEHSDPILASVENILPEIFKKAIFLFEMI